MKLQEIITWYEPTKLHHPIVGDVNWDYSNSDGCFTLHWDHGPEAKQALIVDEAVLLSDEWTLRE